MPDGLGSADDLSACELRVPADGRRPAVAGVLLAVWGQESILGAEVAEQALLVELESGRDRLAFVSEACLDCPIGDGCPSDVRVDQRGRRQKAHVVEQGDGLALVHLRPSGVNDLNEPCHSDLHRRVCALEEVKSVEGKAEQSRLDVEGAEWRLHEAVLPNVDVEPRAVGLLPHGSGEFQPVLRDLGLADGAGDTEVALDERGERCEVRLRERTCARRDASLRPLDRALVASREPALPVLPIGHERRDEDDDVCQCAELRVAPTAENRGLRQQQTWRGRPVPALMSEEEQGRCAQHPQAADQPHEPPRAGDGDSQVREGGKAEGLGEAHQVDEAVQDDQGGQRDSHDGHYEERPAEVRCPRAAGGQSRVEWPSMPNTASPLDQLSINAIRVLSIDAILKANSGHPGLPLGAAPMAWALWSRHLRHSPSNPSWPNRDRFVLSAGHGSMLLYSLLHLTGYDLPLSELQQFRQWGSKTPGHPEHGLTAGVETTTGPLGQGFAMSVGMAMAEAHLAARFNRPGHTVVDHHTFALVGDGDLMEGVALEAASLAGHLRLGKLVALYDSNRISLAGATDLSFTQDMGRAFEAAGWHVQRVADGNDLEALSNAVAVAKATTDRPSLIVVSTEIGFGSPKQGTSGVHGSPLNAEQVLATKRALGYPSEEPFFVPAEVVAQSAKIVEKGKALEAEWKVSFDAYRKAHPDLAAEFDRAIARRLPEGWDRDIPTFTAADKPMATRAAGGKVLNAIAARVPEIFGGSADLNPSTETAMKGFGDFECPAQGGNHEGAVGSDWGYAGRNVHFGVREHAMGAVANGLALHGGIRPFTATFFTFSDYQRPSIRLAALMELPVVFVFTHDSIGVGEDGPTHQPVEHAAALRTIPNVLVLRPADAAETAAAWRLAMTHTHGPTALLLTRQAVPNLGGPADVARGGYVLADGPSAPELVIVASGSEVSTAVEVRAKLVESGISVRVVSMPSPDLFLKQDAAWRDSVLPPNVWARMSIEAGVSYGWHRIVGPLGDVVAIDDRFGASAPLKVLHEKLGLTAEEITVRAKAYLAAYPARAKALSEALGRG